MKKNKKEDRVKKFNKIWVAACFAFGMNFAYAYEIVIDETNNESEPSVINHINGIAIDGKTKLMWQDDVSVKSTSKNWQDAIRYCNNLEFAGYSDWRLPSRMELLNIADKSKYNPAIKSGFQNVASDVYWSSSPEASDSSSAWFVYFKNGYGSSTTKLYDCLVRCVRDSK